MDDQEYISQIINPLIEMLTHDISVENPSNVLGYILEWLRNRSISASEREELHSLRSQVARLALGNSSSSQSEDEIDTTEESEEEKFEVVRNQSMRQRTSVSAEAYGVWNRLNQYIPKIIPKTQEQKQRILQRLEISLIFSQLDEIRKNVIADAMEAVEVNAGEIVISQGDDGNLLYVVDAGKLECFKQRVEGVEFLRFYETGEAFGELALLYNCPRAASIRAVADCKLWALDRESFVHIVKNAVVERRNRFEGVLAKIPFMNCVGSYEKDQLADGLKEASFAKGEYVIREGEWGDLFYIIESGNAIAVKNLRPGLPPTEVFKYNESDYFGELALLKGEPRAASIIADTDLKCLTLDRQSFKRLLGSLEDLLKKNTQRYETFNN